MPLDLSGYDAIEVHFFESQVLGRRFNISQNFVLDTTGVIRSFSNLANNVATIFLQRRVSATSTGVTFGDGEYRAVTSSGAPTTANDVLVPIAIYGLRKLGGGTN